jgi:transcriptional regulator with XRE-family HTH domain
MSSAAFGYMVKRSLDNAAMKDFSAALKKARNQAHMTMEDVAKRFGITRSAISQWEDPTKNSRPDLEKLPALADMYRVDLGSLLNGLVVRTDTGDLNAAVTNALPGAPPMSGTAPTLSGSAPVIAWSDAEGPPSGMVTVPRLRMSLSMGTGKIMFEVEEHEEGSAFRADWLASMCLKPGSCFMAKVEGSSMEPKLEEGESVLIDRAQVNIIDRKIYAISYDGKIYCKRLFKAGAEVIMRSDNSEFPEIRAQAEEVQIIGRVVWHAGAV